MRVVYHLHHTLNVFFVNDDTGKAEYAPSGIVGMDGHVNVVFVTGGHDALKEVFEVGKKFLIVNIFVHFEELFNLSHSFGLPAGHYVAVGVILNAVEHFLGLDGIDGCLIVSKNGGAVGTLSGKFGSGPVKNRHEVVTYHVDVFLTETLQRLNIIVNVLFSFG